MRALVVIVAMLFLTVMCSVHAGPRTIERKTFVPPPMQPPRLQFDPNVPKLTLQTPHGPTIEVGPHHGFKLYFGFKF